MNDLKEIWQHSQRNRAEIQESDYCGCFYCLQIFSSLEIDDYVDDGDTTALCPYCNIDSVIPDAAGYEIDQDLLNQLNEKYFGEQASLSAEALKRLIGE